MTNTNKQWIVPQPATDCHYNINALMGLIVIIYYRTGESKFLSWSGIPLGAISWKIFKSHVTLFILDYISGTDTSYWIEFNILLLIASFLKASANDPIFSHCPFLHRGPFHTTPSFPTSPGKLSPPNSLDNLIWPYNTSKVSSQIPCQFCIRIAPKAGQKWQHNCPPPFSPTQDTRWLCPGTVPQHI